MARIHTDLHFIPADRIPTALSLLYSSGLITRSLKDVRFSDIQHTKRQFPDSGAFFEVKTIY